MSLLIAAILVALVSAGWVVYPILFRRWGLLGDVVPAEVAERDARKRVALAALKDAEYDRAAGKLDAADYEEVRALLEFEALDAVRSAASASPAADGEIPHACGFINPAASRFCAGCGQRLA